MPTTGVKPEDYYTDDRGVVHPIWADSTIDHGGLSGLSDDDHNQYHNNARGDARYLYRENTDAFTPDGDYEPATKKYVDDNAALLARPVGTVYEQVATSASNDAATALPTSEAPATLFGGTWEKLWDSESDFFRTEGTDADDGRTDGRQLDQMQKITGKSGSDGNWSLIGSSDTGNATGAISFDNINAERYTSGTSGRGIRLLFDSANSPNARTSSTTSGEGRVTNRLVRYWRRTS